MPTPALVLAHCHSRPFLPTAHVHSWSSDPWAAHVHSGVPLPAFILACHHSRLFVIHTHLSFVPTVICTRCCSCLFLPTSRVHSQSSMLMLSALVRVCTCPLLLAVILCI